MTEPQLTYTITTSPQPLEITPRGRSPESSRITIMVSRAGSPVNCGGLKITFKQGATESDLTTHLKAITPSVSGDEKWRIDLEDEGSFVVRPEQDSLIVIGTQALLLEFSDVQVNRVVGVTRVEIAEWIGRQTTEGDPTASTTAKITKYLPGFRFADFYVVDENGQVGQPVGMGKKATLRWTASQGADYSLLHDNTVENVTDKREFEITPTRDTTYYLRAEVTGGGEKTEHFLSTTVQVVKPQIIATSLDVDNVTIGPQGVAKVFGSPYKKLWVPSSEELAEACGRMPFDYGKVFSDVKTDGFALGYARLVGGSVMPAVINIGVEYTVEATHSFGASMNTSGSSTYSSFLAPISMGGSFTTYISINALDLERADELKKTISNTNVFISFYWCPFGGKDGVSASQDEGAVMA